MKSLKLVVVAMSLVGIFGVGNAMAVDSTTVNVSATVVGSCAFAAASYDMAFGSFAVTDTGNKTATANVQFTCTNNTSYTLDDFSIAPRNMVGPASENLAYTIAPVSYTHLTLPTKRIV